MKRYNLNLNLTGVIVLVALGVLLPVMLSTAAGIVSITIARNAGGIVTGVLVISFTAAAAGSALIAVVLTSKKARLARRQADFVASVSHELRTPLSAIKLYAQTLQSDEIANDPDHRNRCLSTILRETEWLDATVDRVLMWRASSRDALQLNMKRQSVCHAVDNAIERFSSMVDAGEIRLSRSIESRLEVYHDPAALNAVILNLLTNAYRYSGEDKEINVRAFDRDGEAVIEVEDNGPGLKSSEIKRVFQPFYRTDRTDKGTSGAGLGLSIAQHMIEQHGGRITVRSTEGKGSSFIIILPEAPGES
jgi:two-component system phosphate regulon sensor histidine kinase PhoR